MATNLAQMCTIYSGAGSRLAGNCLLGYRSLLREINSYTVHTIAIKIDIHMNILVPFTLFNLLLGMPFTQSTWKLVYVWFLLNILVPSKFSWIAPRWRWINLYDFQSVVMTNNYYLLVRHSMLKLLENPPKKLNSGRSSKHAWQLPARRVAEICEERGPRLKIERITARSSNEIENRTQ